MAVIFPSGVNVGMKEYRQYAASVANSHKVIRRDGDAKFLPDIEKCRDITVELYNKIISEKPASQSFAMPAEEWLCDNFHIIAEQYDNVIAYVKSCRRSAFRGMPVVRELQGAALGAESAFCGGCAAGMSIRAYSIAKHITDMYDAHVDEAAVKEFIEEYQNTAALTSAEIGNLGEMLRVALLVKVAGVCAEINRINQQRRESEKIFERLNKYLDEGDITPGERKRAVDIWISSTEELTPILAETVLRLAASSKGDTTEYREIFELKLAGRNTSVDKMLTAERNMRTSLGVTMGNAVRSLSRLSTFDWDTISSELCTVERILDTDPCGVFPLMDRDSRSYYIHCTETIARRANVSAGAVAVAAVERAEEFYNEDKDDVRGHVGYFLCDDGVKLLDGKIHKGFRMKLPKRPRGVAASAAFMACAAVSASVLTFITAVIISREMAVLWSNPFIHLIFGLLTVVPSFLIYMNISVSVIQTIFAKFYKPVVLPAMNFDSGMQDGCSVFFVMPVLMKNPDRVREIMREIEIIYLANRDENIYFAVVADAAESDSEHAEWDSEVYSTGLEEAERLNELYGYSENRKFFFFYRPRVFHNCEGKWLGRERKRGALIDFNKLVTGEEDHNLLGMTDGVPKVKFVMTVDADTRIPNNSIRKMAAISAHPLNRPQVEYSGGCAFVKRGYGILQPAIMTEPLREGRSPFAETYTGDVGIDAYFARNSDFYFDVCLEGIYTGKGMYDPQVFNEISNDTFRDETVLSHDLLEGSYMRTAFTSNIMIFDGFPGNYSAYIKRQHRWIRGDWQLLPYKKNTFINRLGRKVKNPLNFISLYKITNNLQRSLAAPCIILIFAVGMIFMPQLAVLWHAVLLGYAYYQWLLYPTVKTFKRCSLALCSLPHEAYMSLDAIVRTLWRINVSHKHLLSWVTAADAERGAVKSVAGYYKFMWPCILIGLITVSPVSLLWFASPLIICKSGEPPIKRKKKKMSDKDEEILALCRRMWAFYEEYAPENSFLPPDNVQFKPEKKIAGRTSPTNIGFFILCTAQAARLGFISLSDAVWLIERTMSTVDRMEKINGHLLNWYNTKNLEVLNPPFVSVVDSGNMAVCMVTAAEMLSEEYKRTAENPADVIKSRYNGIKSLIYIIREDRLSDDGETIGLPDDFDGRNLEEWQTVLETCINFCDRKEKGAEDKNLFIKRLRSTCECYLHELKKSLKVPTGETPSGCLNCDTKPIESKLNKVAFGMDFTFLFDSKKGCFSTGFAVRDNRLCDSYYDIAVSEARLSIYFAIAKGDVPADAFYRPARRFLDKGKGILRSWSGTAFEYLLPELFFRAYPGLLWDKTIKLMIDAQREYGEINGVPWGISESGYNQRDINLNYKYKAFGVPKLAMHRECCDGLVIAPYASIMAIEFAPEAVKENLKLLKEKGAFGEFGYCESVDFTKGRNGVVSSYMAHHIGMAFTGCTNYLESDFVGKAFSGVPSFSACELLLAERCGKKYGSKKVSFSRTHCNDGEESRDTSPATDYFVPFVHDGVTSVYPAVTHFSGRNSSLFVNELGENFLSLGDMAVTCGKGLRFYIRECNSGKIWSATLCPDVRDNSDGESYRVLFYPERAIFCRTEDCFKSELHLCVSAEDNSAVYKLELINGSQNNVFFEITAFTEVAVALKRDFEAHRSYSDINTVTACDESANFVHLFADKIYRSGLKDDMSAFMSIWADKDFDGALQFDTDTVNFVGRGNSAEYPSAVYERRPLGAKHGAVLTPCFAARGRLAAAPGETVRFYAVIGAAKGFEDSCSAQERVRNIASKYRDSRSAVRAFDLAYTSAVIEKDRLRLSREFLEDCGNILKQIYNREIYARRNGGLIERLDKGILPGIWRFGISGNNPIILAEIKHSENRAFTESIINVWKFLYCRGLMTDLVIAVNEEEGYLSPLYSYAEHAASVGMCDVRDFKSYLPCGIFVIKTSQFEKYEIDCITAGAAVKLIPARRNRVGTAAESDALKKCTLRRAEKSDRQERIDATEIDGEDRRNMSLMVNSASDMLHFYNGYGGFSKDGKSYVILGNKPTPSPWVNCINSFYGDLGFTVSESGGGFAWYLNSHEFRLTPWDSSPVHDIAGETIYVRNENSGGVFALTPSKKTKNTKKGQYLTNHGFGYTEFETAREGMKTKLTVFAHSELPLKISFAEIENKMADTAEISVAYFVRPVMGEKYDENAPFSGTYWDDERNVLICENRRKPSSESSFAGKIFICSSLVPDSFTGDETEFFGGELCKAMQEGVPAAMSEYKLYLSDSCGFGLKPCMAMKNTISIKSGASASLVYVLAAEPSDKKILIDKAIENLRNPFKALNELNIVKKLWDDFLGTIEVRTPDKSFDFMVNGWLLYQLKSCRIDGRSAFYQSGGAYGFRDQLQDAIALLHADTEAVKKQILLCASRQYEEGDVQHWWHPPENAGVRTHYSDDLLWLPFAVYKYVEFTDDVSVLREKIPFLKSDLLSPLEHDRYERAAVTDYSETLFEHCRRAVEHSLKFGAHGLPLMGGGDWNDGMNKVGENGGESVWLGWFLCTVLKYMQFLSDRIGAGHNYQDDLSKIAASIEKNAWDGDRYIRAFYGDKTPLGSSSCVECEIDSISQSWSVISGTGNKERAGIAVNSAYTNLVDTHAKTVRLLSPPFKGFSHKNPGYISDYPVGIRENGAQYTHAAIWLAKAFYEIGQPERGYEILSMINPVNHSRTENEADIYKTEPYVIAADVYYGGDNTGRGGWTWYTGSAGWFYRLCIENVLGIRRCGNVLDINPSLPASWHGKALLKYRHNGKVYDIDLSKGSQRIVLN